MADTALPIASSSHNGGNDAGVTKASHRFPRDYQRAYKACIPCRKRKAKCNLTGDNESGVPEGPPCARCRREHRECIFSAERNYNAKRARTEDDFDIERILPQPRSAIFEGSEIERRRTMSQHYGSNHTYHDGTQHSPTATRSALEDSVMRTTISSGNDALNILFEAAAAQEARADSVRDPSVSLEDNPMEVAMVQRTLPSVLDPRKVLTVGLTRASSETLRLWTACRFVRQGWMTAEEAVTYVDMFFKNMSTLSPIITNYYAEHRRHFKLLSQEPMLCCTILMLSSRYHILPGIGGASRGYYIHDRLWKHCQHLITRLMFGQEKGSNAKVRTVGMVEALLLLSEWHPRALHFPPDIDGWDSDLLLSIPENDVRNSASTSSRWLSDVIEPARRSDRMSWMLLGSALTLAHELGIFDDGKPGSRGSQSFNLSSTAHADYLGPTDEITADRRLRIRKLLYVFINHLSSRLGYVSLLPHSQAIGPNISSTEGTRDSETMQWTAHMASWIELTKLVKSVSDMFFPSPEQTRQLLHTGRYTGLLEHFLPLLEQWRKKHLDGQAYLGPYQETLFIEYNYVRIYINSLGMQAVCERAVSDMDGGNSSMSLVAPNLSTILGGSTVTIDETEYSYIQEVLDGACTILSKAISLAEMDSLRFCPIRVFLRITTSSIFLLKAISLGVKTAKFQSSLETLEKAVQAVRTSNLDDMHLAARYATLIEMHVGRLRQGLGAVNFKKKVVTRNSTGKSTPAPGTTETDGTETKENEADVERSSNVDQVVENETSGLDFSAFNGLHAEDWFALPFDPSMAPFAPGGDVGFPGLEGSGLDFIWNLPTE